MARKGKRGKGDLFFDVIIVILLCVIAFSLFKVASILNEYQKGTREYKQIAKDADLKLEENRLHIDWKALKKKNDDLKKKNDALKKKNDYLNKKNKKLENSVEAYKNRKVVKMVDKIQRIVK